MPASSQTLTELLDIPCRSLSVEQRDLLLEVRLPQTGTLRTYRLGAYLDKLRRKAKEYGVQISKDPSAGVVVEYVIRDATGLACSFSRDWTHMSHETDAGADKFTFEEAEVAILELSKAHGKTASFEIAEIVTYGDPDDHATVREVIDFSDDRDHRLIQQ